MKNKIKYFFNLPTLIFSSIFQKQTYFILSWYNILKYIAIYKAKIKHMSVSGHQTDPKIFCRS